MLIAADGLNSVSRKYLFPDHQPKFQNLSAWRTCIKIDENIPDIFVDPNLFISKNLERIGDHATNVAETITYMASGEIKVEPRPKIN